MVEENREGEGFPLYPGAGRFPVPVVDSEDQDILVQEIRIVVTVPGTVASSVTASRRREEPEPDLLSPQACQPGLFARVVHGRKYRRSVTLFEQCIALLLLKLRDTLLQIPRLWYRPANSSRPHEFYRLLVAAVHLEPNG